MLIMMEALHTFVKIIYQKWTKMSDLKEMVKNYRIRTSVFILIINPPSFFTHSFPSKV